MKAPENIKGGLLYSRIIMKTIRMQDNKRFRLVESRKRKVNKGEFFLDQESDRIKKSPINTVDKFYVYDFEGTGRYYKVKRNDTSQVQIRDALESTIVAAVYRDSLVDTILSSLNQPNLNSDGSEP